MLQHKIFSRVYLYSLHWDRVDCILSLSGAVIGLALHLVWTRRTGVRIPIEMALSWPVPALGGMVGQVYGYLGYSYRIGQDRIFVRAVFLGCIDEATNQKPGSTFLFHVPLNLFPHHSKYSSNRSVLFLSYHMRSRIAQSV